MATRKINKNFEPQRRHGRPASATPPKAALAKQQQRERKTGGPMNKAFAEL